MLGLDPSKLSYLASNYDPRPILSSLDMGGGGGLQPSAAQAGSFGGGQYPWQSIVNPASTTPAPTFSGIDPKLMSQFGAALQTPPTQPHFIGGASPQKPSMVQMQQMQQPMGMPAVAPHARPSLAALLQGRG